MRRWRLLRSRWTGPKRRPGISPPELKKIWWYRRKMYRQFSIAKGRGKTRLICAPDRQLKILQRKMAYHTVVATFRKSDTARAICAKLSSE